jgi:hypothetical protein
MPTKIPEWPQSKSLSDVGSDFPKVGDRVGDRTVINVGSRHIIFGKKEGNIENCGAYVTDFREWFVYEHSLNK